MFDEILFVEIAGKAFNLADVSRVVPGSRKATCLVICKGGSKEECECTVDYFMARYEQVTAAP